MAEQMLNRSHPDAHFIAPRCHRSSARMAARIDARFRIDRFEPQAQTDIAEMPTSPSAANEGPMIVKLADRGQIAVQ